MRKTRSDKKKDVKATLSLDLKDAIFRLSYICFTPVKHVSANLCHYMIAEYETIGKLSPYFQYDLIRDSTMFKGHHTNKQIPKRIDEPKSRVTIVLERADYDAIYKLAFALNVSPSRTCAILLEMAMNDANVVNDFVKDYLQAHTSTYYMDELKYLLRYAERHNAEKSSWLSLLVSIVEEKGSAMLGIKEIVKEYVQDKNKNHL